MHIKATVEVPRAKASPDLVKEGTILVLRRGHCNGIVDIEKGRNYQATENTGLNHNENTWRHSAYTTRVSEAHGPPDLILANVDPQTSVVSVLRINRC